MDVFKLCGQDSIGPSGVFDQSISRINLPISPPPVIQPEAPDVFALLAFPFMAFHHHPDLLIVKS
jgi:hypothetical protein